ncbi:unnamed protein product [Cylindrotheca closterium]|uniref:Uncharacterized protein n=1 Tax=Cylindrotheca closterium TaxID=2856 RepID=A0AAD2PW96_9STRA|nr:unnamed protein product [Cylindrotheca closterium]
MWDKAYSPHDFRMFFRWNINRDQLKATVDDLVKFLEQGGKKPGTNVYQQERQFVGISHKVIDTALTHDFDMLELHEKICFVFLTFYKEGNEGEYYGPCICFVQSSGTGKTKILYKLCKHYKMNEEGTSKSGKGKSKSGTNIVGRLILCRNAKGESDENKKEKDLFDAFIDLRNGIDSNQSFQQVVDGVFKKLDDMIALFNIADEPTVLVLFFDKAHYLLDEGNYTKEKEKEKEKGNGKGKGKETKTTTMDAMLFCIVCLWIRKKRGNLQIVAVFTGTTAKLTNFITDDDITNKTDTNTCEYTSPKLEFYMRGEKTSYTPFYTTTTIGCLRFVKMDDSSSNKSGYSVAVPCGRPLFAAMSEQELKAGESIIVQRIVQDASPSSFKNTATTWLSVLGTRVQMRQTTFDAASGLVGRSYANLVSVSPATVNGNDKQTAKICFPPDPVCARLAMCLMDDSWSMALSKDTTLNGRPKVCGDDGDDGDDMMTQNNDCQVHFSAIQVCCNYARAYDDSWSLVQNEVFLENMYKTGVGFYVFAGCSVIDVVFALQISVAAPRKGGVTATSSSSSKRYQYVPMFVSIKLQSSFCPKSASIQCDKMKAKLEAVKGGSELGALCLLVVFGSSVKSKDGDYTLKPDCVKNLEEGMAVSKVLRIPTNDEFGLTEAFWELTGVHDEMSEVLASHSFLGAHREADSETTTNNFTGQVLRLRPKLKTKKAAETQGIVRKTDEVTGYLDKLLAGLDDIVRGQPSDGEKEKQKKRKANKEKTNKIQQPRI